MRIAHTNDNFFGSKQKCEPGIWNLNNSILNPNIFNLEAKKCLNS